VKSTQPGRAEVNCPACGKTALFAAANRWRPFCSERCRVTDLGAWASESYRIPAKPDDDGEPSASEESQP
jgi:endogenous inhibitor of DNA gyrase (YacG/DUF329 family)